MKQTSLHISFVFLLSIFCLINAPVCQRPATAGWQIEVVDGGWVGKDASLAFDLSGNPAISYCDYTSGNYTLKYAHYNGNWWDITTVDSLYFGGSFTSLAFNPVTGKPAISYNGGGSLNYASFNGTSWDVTTVDSLLDGGWYTSLAFDTSGKPAISYYDRFTNRDLKYAYFNGTNWVIETVDSAGNVGAWASLAFDPSGNPAISYLDYTNYNLKFAHFNGATWDITIVGPLYYYEGRSTSLAFNPLTGKPAISYGGNDCLNYASFNGTSWDITTLENVFCVACSSYLDGKADVDEYPSLAFDSFMERSLDPKVLYALQTGYTSLAFDASGKPAISYLYWNRISDYYFLGYIRFNGTSWNMDTLDYWRGNDTFGSYPTSLAFDASGKPAISYSVAYDDDSNPRELKYAHYNYGWKITTIDSSENVGKYTSLAFNPLTDNPSISYYDETHEDLKYASFNSNSNDNSNQNSNNGTSWDIGTIDFEGEAGKYTSLAFDASGNPSISYHGYYINDALKFAHFNGNWWDVTTVDSGDGVGKYTSLAFDSSGNPAVSYHKYNWWNITGDLKYVHFNGTSWDITPIASSTTGVVGEFTSLAFDGMGNPAISYHDDNGGLKFARFNGTTWDITTVGPGGSYPSTSLAFDLSDNPAISYCNWYNGDIKFAHGNGSSWDITTVDSMGTGGWDTSLAFDASGNPAISYSSSSGLKYAHFNGTLWDIITVDSRGGGYISLAFSRSGNPAISYYDGYNTLKFARFMPGIMTTTTTTTSQTTTTTLISTTTTTTTSTTTTSTPSPKLCASPKRLVFRLKPGENACKTFYVWNCGKEALQWQVSESCSWLTVQPASGDSTGEKDTVNVCVDTTGLSRGRYNCTISVTSNGGNKTIPVKLRVR